MLKKPKRLDNACLKLVSLVKYKAWNASYQILLLIHYIFIGCDTFTAKKTSYYQFNDYSSVVSPYNSRY